MKTIAALHSEHKHVSGEISFLKQKTTFFLKLLSRENKNPASYQKVNLLDGKNSYGKGCTGRIESISEDLKTLKERFFSFMTETISK